GRPNSNHRPGRDREAPNRSPPVETSGASELTNTAPAPGRVIFELGCWGSSVCRDEETGVCVHAHAEAHAGALRCRHRPPAKAGGLAASPERQSRRGWPYDSGPAETSPAAKAPAGAHGEHVTPAPIPAGNAALFGVGRCGANRCPRRTGVPKHTGSVP